MILDLLKSLLGFNENFKTIAPAELKTQLEQKAPLMVIDVRAKNEFKTGHIAKAKSMPLPNLKQHTAKLAKNKPIVCVCRSGQRSRLACNQLMKAGFTDVTNMSGGMLAWQQAGLPVR